MRALRLLLRLFSYLVNGAMALAALAMSVVILRTPGSPIQVGWLPWSGETLGPWLAALGIAGLAVIALCLAGRLRGLLLLYSLVVLVLFVRGMFFSAWRFAGEGDFKLALWMTLALAVSMIGAVPIKPLDKGE